MFILIRLLFIGLFLWALARFLGIIFAATSDARICTRCDGKGYYYNTRERVNCKLCHGSGKVLKA